MIIVYLCYRHDLDQNADVLVPRWRSREAAKRGAASGLVILEHTALEVDDTALNSEGMTDLDFDHSPWTNERFRGHEIRLTPYIDGWDAATPDLKVPLKTLRYLKRQDAVIEATRYINTALLRNHR